MRPLRSVSAFRGETHGGDACGSSSVAVGGQVTSSIGAHMRKPVRSLALLSAAALAAGLGLTGSANAAQAG